MVGVIGDPDGASRDKLVDLNLFFSDLNLLISFPLGMLRAVRETSVYVLSYTNIK